MHGKELCMEGSEELKEQPKLCVLKELVSRGFEARCVGVRRKKIRRILTKLSGVQQSCRWRWGDGEVSRGRTGSVQNVIAERWRM